MTPAELRAWYRARYGHPLGEGPRPRRHPDAIEAEEREMERAERDRDWAGFATDAEMDGAAADYAYGREPAGDWRQP